MTGHLQILARIGRGEPIAGAARAALPPRFAAPVRGDDAQMLEAWQDEQQPGAAPDPATPDTNAADEHVAALPPQRSARVAPEDAQSPLRIATESDTAAQPILSREVPPPPSADTAATPREPARLTQPHEATAREAPRRANEAAATLSAAPLGQAVLASQVPRRREAPPVIKVTIDRIDIRSPEPPRPARAARPAPKPSVALSDYLRRPGPGERA